jgi:rhodanese-related sulfurtransferase
MTDVNPMNVPTVSLDQLPPDALVLDVREPHEWDAGHIDAAVHVPMNAVPSTVAHEPATIPSERRVHVICAAGGRSAQVTAWLVANGVDAVNVAGGMHAWEDAGRPMVSSTDDAPRVV